MKTQTILLLLAFCLISTQAARVKTKKAQRSFDCTVQLIKSDGSVGLEVSLVPGNNRQINRNIGESNDNVGLIKSSGNCHGCSMSIYQGYDYNDQILSFNLETKPTVKLSKYYCYDNPGNLIDAQYDSFGNAYGLWSRQISSFIAVC